MLGVSRYVTSRFVSIVTCARIEPEPWQCEAAVRVHATIDLLGVSGVLSGREAPEDPSAVQRLLWSG